MDELSLDAPQVVSLSLDELVSRARRLLQLGRRTVLGITGAPGAGKSTACAALMTELGDQAVLVGMDGFHLANRELHRLGRRHRKGAADTFDVDGYVALLRRLRQQSAEVIYAPHFDRGIEESIGSAIPVHRSVPLVVTEGNYLLLDHDGWADVRGCLDEAWYLEVAADLRVSRLIGRRRHFGDDLEAATTWVHGVDQVNGGAVEQFRDRADLVISLTTHLEVAGAASADADEPLPPPPATPDTAPDTAPPISTNLARPEPARRSEA